MSVVDGKNVFVSGNFFRQVGKNVVLTKREKENLKNRRGDKMSDDIIDRPFTDIYPEEIRLTRDSTQEENFTSFDRERFDSRKIFGKRTQISERLLRKENGGHAMAWNEGPAKPLERTARPGNFLQFSR